jgi:hypothetical protein
LAASLVKRKSDDMIAIEIGGRLDQLVGQRLCQKVNLALDPN